MSVVRTFVAVPIAEDLKANISAIQEAAKQIVSDVRWVSAENVHVTLKFLGNVGESDLAKVFEAVEEAAQSNRAFEMSLSGLGAFPNLQKARVVWIGVEEGGEQLVKLAAAIEDCLAKAGFLKEDREFRAHITIGRAKDRFAREVGKIVDRIDARDVGKQKVSAVEVMKSDLRPNGPVYTVLKTIKLASA